MMERTLELSQAAELFVLDNFPVKTIPNWAANALSAGYDSPSLRELSGIFVEDHQEIRDLFQKALRELGVELPSPSEAGLSMARHIADDIIRGVITPYAGAKRIWSSVYARFPDLKDLIPFVGCASEYEDDEAHRSQYEQLIVEECKNFLHWE